MFVVTSESQLSSVPGSGTNSSSSDELPSFNRQEKVQKNTQNYNTTVEIDGKFEFV